MGGVSFNNFDSVARAFDTNKNGKVDELRVPEHIQAKIDTNQDGDISTKELASAMKADVVEVRNGEISHSRGLTVNTQGLETLKNVHTISRNASEYAFTSDYSQYQGEARVNALVENNMEYARAIRSMESSLRNIDSMTRGNGDSISRSVNSTTRNALSDSGWLKLSSTVNTIFSNNGRPSVYQDPFSNGSQQGGQVDTSGLENANADLRSAYRILHSAISNVSSATSDLPDIRQTAKSVDLSITKAFSNINEIKASPKTPVQVKDKLYELGKAQDAQVTGRAAPYAGVGAIAGGITGGVAGYFAGKNGKAISIGVAAGTAAGAGIGALVGKMKDDSFKDKANALRQLGDDVTRYNPAQDEDTLDGAAHATYNQVIQVRERTDIDSAIGANSNLKGIDSKAKDVENRTSRLADGYRKANQ